MPIVHHQIIKPSWRNLDPRPTSASGASSAGNFTMRRGHYEQVARGVSGAFRARGVLQ